MAMAKKRDRFAGVSKSSILSVLREPDADRLSDEKKLSELERHTRLWVQKANELAVPEYGIEVPVPVLVGDLKGDQAGQIVTDPDVPDFTPVFRYNFPLLQTRPRQYILEVVPHEVAHAVVRTLFKDRRVQSHGQEWCAVMKHFGRPPLPQHMMVTVPARGGGHLYICECQGREGLHVYSDKEHQWVLNGHIRTCLRCNTVPRLGVCDNQGRL
jgi:SprT protein